jgi:hypothetical protein
MTATTETVYRHQIEQAAMPGAEILGDVLRPRSRRSTGARHVTTHDRFCVAHASAPAGEI